MKLFAIAAALTLSACSTTVPVKQPFPAAPQILSEHCSDLLTIDNNKNSMQDLLKVVVQNYALYYQCAEKTHSWQDWYNEQKRIHESANK